MNSRELSVFLKEAGAFYLATTDGDQPKIRPMGYQEIIDNVLYFGVGKHKNCYKQMCDNPKIEIVALHDGKWIRLYGKAIFEQNNNLATDILERNTKLKKMYNEKTGNEFGVFKIDGAVVEVICGTDIQKYSL